jgi:cell division protein FtsB
LGLVFFLSAVFFLFTSLLGDKSLLHLQRMEGEKERWVRANDRLAEENRVLREEIVAAREDPFTVERISREELGLVKENEVVYLFDPREIRPADGSTVDAR